MYSLSTSACTDCTCESAGGFQRVGERTASELQDGWEEGVNALHSTPRGFMRSAVTCLGEAHSPSRTLALRHERQRVVGGGNLHSTTAQTGRKCCVQGRLTWTPIPQQERFVVMIRLPARHLP